MPEKTISLHEAHRRYGVALSTLRRKIKSGELTRARDGGVTVASLKRLYGEPESDPRTEGERSGIAPRSGVVSLLGAEGGALPPEHVALVATLQAKLEAADQAKANQAEAHRREIAAFETARTREVAAQNNYIDGLRDLLEQAHEENKALHMQIADARRHETARLAPPSAHGPTIEGEEAADRRDDHGETRKRRRRDRPASSAAPAVAPKRGGGWFGLGRWFGHG